jgi:hypothetical protein
MSASAGPNTIETGLVLSIDAANPKSLNIPSQADHGYADWYCFVSGTATYSIVNDTGGIIYENNAGTITALVTATGPQRGTISVVSGRRYYGNVPINLVTQDVHHRVAPLTMAGTQFWNIAVRNNPSTYYIYSPYQTATVNFYDNVATGMAGTPTSTITVNAGQVGTFTPNTLTNHWISSNVPVIATATQTGWDTTILSPMSKYVYQRYQAYLNTTNNTVPTNNIAYVTYDSNYNVMNMNIGDGSGGDSAQGLGLQYLSDRYSWGDVLSDYTIVFPYNAIVTAEYWNGTDWIIWDTHNITNGSITNPPRVARDGTNGPGVEASQITGFSANMASGATLWRWVGTAPFYLCINDNADAEFSVLGWLNSTISSPRSGNSINDISANLNNGTLINSPLYFPTNDGELVFDGTRTAISIPHNASLTPTSSITLEAWAKMSNWNETTVANGTRIISKTENGNYQLAVNDGTVPNEIGIVIRIGGTYYGAGYARSLVSSGWHHLCGTFDGRYVRFYLDGVLRDTADFGSQTTMNTANNSLLIGAEPDASTGITGNYFNGSISKVNIYNVALTNAEIIQNFNATRGRYGI